MGEQVHGESEAEPRALSGLGWAVVLTFAILGIESVGAVLSRSLSLTVDAVHDIPDILAFLASWAALRGLRAGSSDHYTFGTHRFEVFAALLNAGLVLAVGGSFAGAALLSLRSGTPAAGAVTPAWILLAALPTLALRAGNLFMLRKVPARARDLNLKSVVVHLGSDLLITGALLFVGFALFFGALPWWVDPGTAVFIGTVLVWESVPLFRGGWDVLTERTPGNVALDRIESALRASVSVRDVHDLHVWAVCPTLICMSAHVEVDPMSVRESMSVVAALRQLVEREFGILHSVFEVETAGV